MRCKPNDVAMVTGRTRIEWSADDAIDPFVPFGTMVKVVSVHGADGIWTIAEPLRIDTPHGRFTVTGIADCCLTPYRPGDADVDLGVALDIAYG